MQDLTVLKLYDDKQSDRIDKFNASIKSEYSLVSDYEKVETDFAWLDIMEDTIMYLDNILRNPNRFIVNEEEVVKVEQAKRITVESIKHLSKHTNFIQEIEDNGDVRPSKVLNVNKDESYNTYENRLIYTLINNMRTYLDMKEKDFVDASTLKDDKRCEYNAATKIGAEKININLLITARTNYAEATAQKNGLSVSQRFEKLTDPISATYTLNNKSLNLSWTSPGTPSAVDTNYLTNYFKNNWKIEATKYLNKRLDYNNKYIGQFGFAIYLTQGSSSTYVGWTKDTSYTIDLDQYTGIYDGVIIKSMYSIFKSNASNGYRLAFMINEPDEIKDSDITVSMNGLEQKLSVGSTFKELNSSSITSIKYKGTEIKSIVANLSVVTSSIKKENSTESITPDKITQNAGTYNITYTVSFTYMKNSVTKTITQTVIVE